MSEPLSAEKLAEIRDRKHPKPEAVFGGVDPLYQTRVMAYASYAREDIPLLLSEIERLKGELAELRIQLDEREP